MDYLMVYLEKIFALAFMTYFLDLDACELHPGDGKIFKICMNES